MYKDPSEFRERFKAYKNGKSVREIYGLPGYAPGKEPNPIEDTADFLRQYEGFRDKTYLDGKGIPTIGYGFTDAKFVDKGSISRAEADIELNRLIKVRQAELRNKLGPRVWDSLSNDSKKALTSYHFNYPAGFKEGTKFMKYWREGRYADAIKEVDAGWNDAANPGLRKRRIAEQTLLRKDPMLYKVIPQKPKNSLIQLPDATRIVSTIPLEKVINKIDLRNEVIAEAERAMWAHDVMNNIQGMAYDVPIWESKSLLALEPIDLNVAPFKTYSGGKLPGYQNGTIQQGHKQIPIDNARIATEPDYTKDGWLLGTLKRGANNFIKTIEYFTDSARRVLNGRGSTEDKINVALDLGGAAGAKAITKVIRKAKVIKPPKASVSLKGNTPKEVADYFDLHPELVSDADPEKVAHAALFIKQDALPRAQLAARKHGRNVDFDPNTVTFKEADFMDSKLGGVSTPNKIVYMRKGAPVDHYTHEMSHEMRRVVGGTPEEASRLLSTYKNSERFLKEHSNFPQLDEDYAVNTQLRDMISYANGGVKGKELDAIIDNMSDDMFERYAILANAYTHDMATTGGLNKNNYKKTLKYVGATYPMLYAAFSRDRYKNGKLPGYGGGLIPITTGGAGIITPYKSEVNGTNETLERIGNFLPYVGTLQDILAVIEGNVAKLPSAIVGSVADVFLPALKSAYKTMQAYKILSKTTPKIIDKIKYSKEATKAGLKLYANGAYQAIGTYQDILDDQGYTKEVKAYKDGKIAIKPSKRGTFTAAVKKHGASVAEFERRVLKNPEKYSKAMVKKARFSHNARSWKH